MYYSKMNANYFAHAKSAGGKRGGMVCELLLKPVNNDGYDATGDEMEIYVRIMDSVHY